MRVSISNIAWDPQHDEAVASSLGQLGLDAIDIAHSKYFPNPDKATDQDIENVRQWWKSRGVDIVGMQALLFGTTGFNVFGSSELRSRMLAHLESVCRIGGGLGVGHLVFGSPKNRDRSGLADEQCRDLYLDFFTKLGDIANSYGVTVCLEPNPKEYGANFMVSSLETKRVVLELSHSNIKMQLDTGALVMNNEDPETIIEACFQQVGHVHASEPLLSLLRPDNQVHERTAALLTKWLPDVIVAIEMKAPDNGLIDIDDTLKFVKGVYGIAGASA